MNTKRMRRGIVAALLVAIVGVGTSLAAEASAVKKNTDTYGAQDSPQLQKELASSPFLEHNVVLIAVSDQTGFVIASRYRDVRMATAFLEPSELSSGTLWHAMLRSSGGTGIGMLGLRPHSKYILVKMDNQLRRRVDVGFGSTMIVSSAGYRRYLDEGVVLTC